jgi:uncharacterized membrane protein
VVEEPGDQALEGDPCITEDEPDRWIGWTSDEGAQVKNYSVAEFRDAPWPRRVTRPSSLTRPAAPLASPSWN